MPLSLEEMNSMSSLIDLAKQVSGDLVEDSRELQQTLSELDAIDNGAQHELVHLVRHCLQDADIRSEDIEYKRMQNEELRRAIAAVEAQLT